MRALALALAATAALAACGGSSGDKPRTLPAITASPSTSPVAAPTPEADVPAEAQPATSAGAEAFARFFYAQTVVAFNSKNPDLIALISAPGCTACKNYVDSLTSLRDNHERVDNFKVEIMDAVAPMVTGPEARVIVSFSAPQAIRYDANGKVLLKDGPYKRIDEQVSLVRQGDHWLIKEVKALRRQA